MSSASIHCPICNATAVTGLGLVIYEEKPLVQYRCRGCGEWFFLPDQRSQNTSAFRHTVIHDD